MGPIWDCIVVASTVPFECRLYIDCQHVSMSEQAGVVLETHSQYRSTNSDEYCCDAMLSSNSDALIRMIF
jgi:hypothetical protein